MKSTQKHQENGQELKISEASVRQIVKKEINLSSYRLQRKHYISEEVAAKRLSRANKLLLKVKNGCLPGLVFVEPGVKINIDYYIKSILEGTLIPWAKKTFLNKQFTFQQDGAPD